MFLNFGENINHGNMLLHLLENFHGSKIHFGILDYQHVLFNTIVFHVVCIVDTHVLSVKYATFVGIIVDQITIEDFLDFDVFENGAQSSIPTSTDIYMTNSCAPFNVVFLVDIMEPCHASHVVMVGLRALPLYLVLCNDVLVLSILCYVPPIVHALGIVPFVVHSSHVETMTLALNLWSW